MKLPKIFLDSGSPEETKKAKGILGFLDGQTTNPTLVARHPEAQKHLERGKKFTTDELLKFYKQIVAELERELSGPISVEVYADWSTTAEVMLAQARDMYTWGRNIHVKFPTIPEGVRAAHQFLGEGGRVNMTLVFDQNQAAAVYGLIDSAENSKIEYSKIFVSPFLGRWYDRGFEGLDLVRNILKMYKKFDKDRHQKRSYPQVLASSIRNLDQFYGSISLGADMLTVPLKILYEWVHDEKWVPEPGYHPGSTGVKSLIYQDLPLKKYEEYTIERVEGDLLDEGLDRFAKDWRNLLK